MGKKKNKNKLSGAAKTAAKTEKKLANKMKKELATLGEEDILKVLAEIEREETIRSMASEKMLPGPPTARAYASLTPHPLTNELIMFGGEYHDGQKTVVYNELLFYSPDKGSWRRVKAPGGPPPRSAHQAVATQANKGELWVFGGEFTSPSETQFHHYKDLWCFSLAEKKWEKVVAPNGPSARSGHRMALLGRKLVVFGGYADDGRECRYFHDLYTFCLDDRVWEQQYPTGRGPSARSACVMLPAGNDSLVIYGGFSRVRVGRSERTHTHTDMFRLSARAGGGWAWRAVAGGPAQPPARAGQAAAVNVHSGRGYVFGGVSDVEETEEDIRGEMSSDLHLLDLESGRFHHVTLRGEGGASTVKEEASGVVEPAVESIVEPVTVVTDEVFTMRLGPAPSPSLAPSPSAPSLAPSPSPAAPSARMSAMLAVQRSTLYLYGGVLERDDKQFYLSDMYCLDLHKMSCWSTLIAQPPLPAWLGSDSEDDSDSSTGEESSDDGEE